MNISNSVVSSHLRITSRKVLLIPPTVNCVGSLMAIQISYEIKIVTELLCMYSNDIVYLVAEYDVSCINQRTSAFD